MKTTTHTTSHRPVLLRYTAGALLAAAAAQAPAAEVVTTRTLCAAPYPQALPGRAAAVPMWGYSGNVDCSSPSSPGPLLTIPSVAAGDTATLVVTLKNSLSVPTSLVLAAQSLPEGGAAVMAPDVVGAATCTPNFAAAATSPDHPQNCRVRSFTSETAPGASATYTFRNIRPGTYLYQSGTHPQVQVQMGLFGMARQDAPLLPGSAQRQLHTGANAGFDNDVSVVLSEIDPDQHDRIQATLGSTDLLVQRTWQTGRNSTLNYTPRYFLINGKVFDAANPGANELPVTNAGNGARIALRLANAGLTSRSLMLNNGTWKLVTEDGYPYPAAREQATALLPAGKTTDALLISTAPPYPAVGRTVAIFDRRGGTDNADGNALGGQVARLAQSGPAVPYIAAVGNQVANEGSTFSLQLTSGNILAYGIGMSPAVGAAPTVSATGLVTWAVPTGTPVPTQPTITVTGSDGVNPDAVQSFAVRVNHTPTTAATGPIAVAHGKVTVPAPGVLAGAADPDGDALTAVLTSAASAGTLTFNADGSYSWSGPQPATGTTAVTFASVARDPLNLASAPRVVTLNVAANQVPTAVSDGTSTTGRQAVTLAGPSAGEALLGLTRAPLSITPNPLNQPVQASTVFAIPLQNIIANDTDTDGRVTSLQLVSVTRGTVSGTGVFTAVALPTTGGTWAEASVTTTSNGDGTGTIRFVPRTRTNTIAGSTVASFPTGTLLQGGATQTSIGVYRVIYRAVDDQGAVSANQGTFYVLVN